MNVKRAHQPKRDTMSLAVKQVNKGTNITLQVPSSKAGAVLRAIGCALDGLPYTPSAERKTARRTKRGGRKQRERKARKLVHSTVVTPLAAPATKLAQTCAVVVCPDTKPLNNPSKNNKRTLLKESDRASTSRNINSRTSAPGVITQSKCEAGAPVKLSAAVEQTENHALHPQVKRRVDAELNQLDHIAQLTEQWLVLSRPFNSVTTVCQGRQLTPGIYYDKRNVVEMFPSPKHRTHLFVNRSSQRCTDKDCPHFQKLAEHPEAQWRQKRWVYVETLKCSDPPRYEEIETVQHDDKHYVKCSASCRCAGRSNREYRVCTDLLRETLKLGTTLPVEGKPRVR
jgi:hypothetical protein